MLRNKTSLFTIALFSLCISLSLMAKAPVPEECKDSYGNSGYTTGYDIEYDFLNDMYNEYSSCMELEYYIESVDLKTIIPSLDPTSSSEWLFCRNNGIINAFYDKNADINKKCSNLCQNDGQIKGEVEARLLCASLAKGGSYNYKREVINSRRQSFSICYSSEVRACKTAFEKTVDTVCRGIDSNVVKETMNSVCKY